MEQILKFKNWQLFLLIVIPGALRFKSDALIFIHLFVVLITTIWIYAIVIYGNKRIIELNLPRIDLKLFSVNIILTLLLSPLAFLYFYYGYGQNGILKVIINIVLFYWVFAILQTVLIAAKTLITIELKKRITTQEEGRFFDA